MVNSNTIKRGGMIYDPVSKKWIPEGSVELGHTYGNEYWRLRNYAESLGMTQTEFNEFMQNPDFYAWQGIVENRSHLYEMPK